MSRFKPAIRLGAACLCAAMLLGFLTIGSGYQMAFAQEDEPSDSSVSESAQQTDKSNTKDEEEILPSEFRDPELLIDVKDLRDYTSYIEDLGGSRRAS